MNLDHLFLSGETNQGLDRSDKSQFMQHNVEIVQKTSAILTKWLNMFFQILFISGVI